MENNYTSIKHWAEDDRPREKLLNKGRSSLSDAELLAILINTGTKNKSAIELAKNLLQMANNNLNELGRKTINEIMQIKGLGSAKAITIAAALELGRRRKAEEAKQLTAIKSSKEAYTYISDIFGDLNHEEFWIILLNQSNKVIGRTRISEGGVNMTIADSRKIFKAAIEKLASGIIFCHNHPSGSLKPSQADIDLTKKLVEGAKLLDITIFDHIIYTDNGYYSFADEGRL
ncbi:MAG: RadC family protein [Bacteroidia bacterium]